MKLKISCWIQAIFYFVLGANHFIDPEAYYELIPPYFKYPEFFNIVAGAAEMLLAIGLVFQKTRKLAAYGIIAMLVVFITSHVHFIQIGSCIEGGLCVPEWLAWLRLIVIHPLLMYWAWSVRNLHA